MSWIERENYVLVPILVLLRLKQTVGKDVKISTRESIKVQRKTILKVTWTKPTKKERATTRNQFNIKTNIFTKQLTKHQNYSVRLLPKRWITCHEANQSMISSLVFKDSLVAQSIKDNLDPSLPWTHSLNTKSTKFWANTTTMRILTIKEDKMIKKGPHWSSYVNRRVDSSILNLTKVIKSLAKSPANSLNQMSLSTTESHLVPRQIWVKKMCWKELNSRQTERLKRSRERLEWKSSRKRVSQETLISKSGAN